MPPNAGTPRSTRAAGYAGQGCSTFIPRRPRPSCVVRVSRSPGMFPLLVKGGDPLFRGQILHDLIRLRVGAELRRQGHADAHALANHLPNSVIDAAINSAPEAKAIGDGTHPILDAFFAFIESPTGQAIIAALIKALLGGL